MIPQIGMAYITTKVEAVSSPLYLRLTHQLPFRVDEKPFHAFRKMTIIQAVSEMLHYHLTKWVDPLVNNVVLLEFGFHIGTE
jgi:hypothetical protein